MFRSTCLGRLDRTLPDRSIARFEARDSQCAKRTSRKRASPSIPKATLGFVGTAAVEGAALGGPSSWGTCLRVGALVDQVEVVVVRRDSQVVPSEDHC